MTICIYEVAPASVLWPPTNWNMPHVIHCPVSLMSGRRPLEQMNSDFCLTQCIKMVLNGLPTQKKEKKVQFKRWLHAYSIMFIQEVPSVTMM
jgi:hypothetical protein